MQIRIQLTQICEKLPSEEFSGVEKDEQKAQKYKIITVKTKNCINCQLSPTSLHFSFFKTFFHINQDPKMHCLIHIHRIRIWIQPKSQFGSGSRKTLNPDPDPSYFFTLPVSEKK